MKAFAALLAELLLSTWSPCLAFAAEAPGNSALRLTITPQRQVYVDCEPVLVEWELVNSGPVPLVLNRPAGIEFLLCQRLEVTDSDERFVTFPPDAVYDATSTPPTMTLPPGKRVTGWFDLLDYARLAPGSTYRVRGVLDTRTYKGVNGMWCSSVTSSTGEFQVVDAKGDDARAAALVEAAIAALGQGRFRGYVFRALNNPDLLQKLLKETTSARFNAVADFFMGLRHYPDERRGKYRVRDDLKVAIVHFDRCAASPAASDRMKAMAMYFAMRCRAEEIMLTPRQQTVDETYAIIDRFPGTWAADQAERFLASLGSPVRPPPERFWSRFWRHGFAAAIAVPALAMLYALYRWWVRYRRAAHFACPRCGYDLRGNPASGRCPECGTPLPAPAVAPPAPPSA